MCRRRLVGLEMVRGRVRARRGAARAAAAVHKQNPVPITTPTPIPMDVTACGRVVVALEIVRRPVIAHVRVMIPAVIPVAVEVLTPVVAVDVRRVAEVLLVGKAMDVVDRAQMLIMVRRQHPPFLRQQMVE